MGVPPARDLLVLFPGALGDFACLWPTLVALRRETSGRLTVVARAEHLPLLPGDGFTPIPLERAELAELYGPGPIGSRLAALLGGHARVLSWTGYGDPHLAARLREASGADAVSVFPFRELAPGEHASRYFARCAGVVPAPPHLEPGPEARAFARGLLADPGPWLALAPGSGQRRKTWEGMAAAAAWWRERGGRVASLLGPAELERGASALEAERVLAAERIDRVAAVLERAGLHLGNDSGVSHLAGLVGARGVALFGPSDPLAWRPLGRGVRVLHAPEPCARCGPERLCLHRLPLERVAAALEEVAALSPPREARPRPAPA